MDKVKRSLTALSLAINSLVTWVGMLVVFFIPAILLAFPELYKPIQLIASHISSAPPERLSALIAAVAGVFGFLLVVNFSCELVDLIWPAWPKRRKE